MPAAMMQLTARPRPEIERALYLSASAMSLESNGVLRCTISLHLWTRQHRGYSQNFTLADEPLGDSLGVTTL
eukprot:5415941-Amphidinium_carterae.1